ncbi:hypothetical protein OQA88_4379 [Cercophora sp. LCS_1]
MRHIHTTVKSIKDEGAWVEYWNRGNVGVPLGHPLVMTSLRGQFTTFRKLVIRAMVIRDLPQALQYSIDRAIMFPHEEGEDRQEERRI